MLQLLVKAQAMPDVCIHKVAAAVGESTEISTVWSASLKGNVIGVLGNATLTVMA